MREEGALAWIEQIIGRRRPKQAAQRAATVDLRAKTLVEQMIGQEAAQVGSRLPKFKSTATDHLDRRGRSTFDEMRTRLYSAFSASQPMTDPRSFAGRTEVLEKLIRATEDLRLHTVLYGERGLGKTSLLLMLAQAAREARYLVVYISCGTRSAFEEVVRSIAARIPLLYCNGVSPNSPEVEAGRTLADLLPPGDISPQAASESLSSIIGTRVLVILDEFDQCQSKEFRLSVAELLKSLSDRSVCLQFLIAGVAANLTELIEHIPSIQRNIFAHQLQRMSSGELRDLIKNGEAITGLRVEQAAANGIIQVANGFPYFACLLICYAGLKALDARRSNVTLDDVFGAIRDAIEQFGGRLSQQSKNQIALFDECGNLESLGRLAGAAQAAGGRFEFEEVQALFPDKEIVGQSKSFIEDLANKKIILLSDDGSEFGILRFKDETAVPYIWFLWAYKHLRETASSKFNFALDNRADSAW